MSMCFSGLLSDRSGYKYEDPGIDGPYLKMLAYAVVERLDQPLEEKVAADARYRSRWRGPIDTFSSPRCMPITTPRPKRLSSKLRDALKQQANPREIWKAMLDAKVLHDGMTVDEAIEMLGQPRHKTMRGSPGTTARLAM